MHNLILACLWLLSAPLGYVALRWCNRTVCTTWTRNDRLFGVIFSLLYGPLMIVFAVGAFLLFKLAESDWGNRDAKW
jgi:hypothetical protein